MRMRNAYKRGLLFKYPFSLIDAFFKTDKTTNEDYLFISKYFCILRHHHSAQACRSYTPKPISRLKTRRSISGFS